VELEECVVELKLALQLVGNGGENAVLEAAPHGRLLEDGLEDEHPLLLLDVAREQEGASVRVQVLDLGAAVQVQLVVAPLDQRGQTLRIEVVHLRKIQKDEQVIKRVLSTLRPSSAALYRVIEKKR